MKNFLNYQTTEYDCGPTTVINAVRFLFEREEIPPAIVKGVMMYGNDTFNDKGENGKRGTSKEAIRYLATWLNGFGKGCSFPIRAEAVDGDEALIEPGSRTMTCLEEGGAALVRCWSGGYGHYVLLTGVEADDCIAVFDPYYEDDLVLTMEKDNSLVIEGQPCYMNRLVRRKAFNRTDKADFAMGEPNLRENLLIWRTDKK